ncbi:poly(A)-specific ribonuclease [Geranomyces variabilis]|nr:poly(A)-specific ribonuclease [Geranomyces variabilis]
MTAYWREARRVGTGTADNPLHPLSTVAFDPLEELLWTGGENGRIASFYVDTTDVTRYTSFPAHASAVRKILLNDQGLFSIGGKNIRHTTRRGIMKWSIGCVVRLVRGGLQRRVLVKSSNGAALASIDGGRLPLSMSFTNTTSELLVGTTDRQMLLVNLFRGSVLKTIDLDADVTVMKQSRVICCGTATGRVVLRDPRTLKAEHFIQTHTGTISDLDISGNIMVTCGFSARAGKLAADKMIKVWDIRTMRALAPIPFPSVPNYLRFHPRLSSTVVAAAQNGQFQISNAANTAEASFYQANFSGFLNAVDFSSSGEALVLADSQGVVSIWSEKDDSSVNFASRPSEFADAPAPRPDIIIDDESPLSLIGMPHYTTRLLSAAWPEKLTFEVGRPAPKIPPEIMDKVKMIDFVGYAPNPRGYKRNQILSLSKKQRTAHGDVPKFRSEQDREKWFGKKEAAQPTGPGAPSPQVAAIPKYYRRVEIKYSKFGIEDFDFGFYNKTPFGGLETHIGNSYCNAMLQVLYFTRPVRELAKAHIKTSCAKEYCLTCELGFLFRMLETAKGANCQATNFLRAFKTIPQANALGLFEPDQPSPSTAYAALIQNFNRFVLEQIQSDLGDDGTIIIIPGAYPAQPPSTMQQIYGLQLQAVSQCACNAVNTRETVPFVVDLTYSRKKAQKKHAGSGKSPAPPGETFVGILQNSINRVSSTKAWCNVCKKYQPTNQYRCLQRPPNIVSINTCATADEDLDLYRSDAPFIPARIAMIFDNGNMTIQPLARQSTAVVAPSGADVAIYDLMATVVEIRDENELPHLVAHMCVETAVGQQWFIFNDFLVQSIPEYEARQFKRWKVPAVIQYKKIDLDALQDFSALPTVPNPNHLREMVLLNPGELPTQPGFLCALDAEFVALSKDEAEIRSDGTRSVIRPSRLTLARVSVLRGAGPLEGHPFIDEYISTTEDVVDYLTEFSGIEAGDLDIGGSRHPLVSLKSAYKKLRLLVDLGCVFVGHGLKKDFRIINILVPNEQVIDTVDLFYIQNRQRKLSLRFLAWVLLKQDIQIDVHDSIEDARTALALYKKYLELKASGRFNEVLDEVYEEGRAVNFKPPPSAARAANAAPARS